MKNYDDVGVRVWCVVDDADDVDVVASGQSRCACTIGDVGRVARYCT